MSLLLQLNGDLPERFPGHERRLYVFSCKKKACRRKGGSLRAFRGTKTFQGAEQAMSDSKGGSSEQPNQQAPALGGAIFSSNALSVKNTYQNPFVQKSGSSIEHASGNPFSSGSQSNASKPLKQPDLTNKTTEKLPALFAEKARIGASNDASKTVTKPSPWPARSELPPSFSSYHLDAGYETLDPTPNSSLPSASINAKMEIDEALSAESEKDAFESSIDKTFQQFADRLAQNPEQILRYEYGGTPLLYSSTDAVGQVFSSSSGLGKTATIPKVKTKTASANGAARGMPSCPSCTAPRVFELQLCPHAITELEADEEGLEGMDWGTVVLGVCSRDCAEQQGDLTKDEEESGAWTWREEWVGVQWEEIAEKGKK